MAKRIVILGAGFAGLELATRLSEEIAGDAQIMLIDRNESFSFGFAKLAVLMGWRKAADVRLPYSEISKPGVEFRREQVNSIDPENRRVETDGGTYEADVLAVAMGADYDRDATPGFSEAGYEYYSVPGAERLSGVIPEFDAGKVLIAILGHPFKCPPAPFEGALLLHDHFTERGIRDDVEIQVVGPQSAPVPVTQEVSSKFVEALGDRDIEYVPETHVTEVDGKGKRALVEGGGEISYDLLIGVPVHRVPEVVERSGLTDGGRWVPVDRDSLLTRFDDVYALGDLTALPMAKAGVFAENAAGVVAEHIVARHRGEEPKSRYEGKGHCWLEFGGGKVAKVEANFLGGPSPTARFVGPSVELAEEKKQFGMDRRERWFGSRSPSA